MKLPEITLLCVFMVVVGMLIGGRWSGIQTYNECNIFGLTEFNGTVFTCIEKK